MHFSYLEIGILNVGIILLRREYKSKIQNRYIITLRFVNLSVPVCFASLRVLCRHQRVQ